MRLFEFIEVNMYCKGYELVDGKKLAYIRVNEWKDNVVLFFHGFTGSKEYFPLDTSDACIISFDRPGVGESALSEYYSMEEFLGNVYKILKQHNVVSVNVIGHSAGGYYAQVFSHLYPDFVKTLSLLSSMVPLNCSKTKSIVKGQWKFIDLFSLKAKNLSKFYFKMMAQNINKNYEKQLQANMKTLPDIERKYMEKNPEMIKNVILNAMANDGLGVCYDAYALCQIREAVSISKNIPVYVWHGKEDKTIPITFVDYFESEYSVKQLHRVDGVGHMLYLPYWDDIIKEINTTH